MLARYQIIRGKRPTADPLPRGIRQDARFHTRHPLRPEAAMVKAYLAAPSNTAWRKFRQAYLALLERRFRHDRAAFDRLADLAAHQDVFLGCNCPTRLNPRVDRCHTFLALQFMARKYRNLDVVLPRKQEAG